MTHEIILRCNKRNLQKFTIDLLSCLFTDEYMASHSLTGSKGVSQEDTKKKTALEGDVVQDCTVLLRSLIVRKCNLFFFAAIFLKEMHLDGRVTI